MSQVCGEIGNSSACARQCLALVFYWTHGCASNQYNLVKKSIIYMLMLLNLVKTTTI